MKLKYGALLSVLVLAACSTTSGARTAWTEYGDAAPAVEMHAGQGVAVFYRDSADRRAVRISADGEYHASLLADGYTAVALCAGSRTIGLGYPESDSRYADKAYESGQRIDIPAGTTSYFKISETPHGASLSAVDAATAQRALAGKKTQAHTVSRVKQQNCAAAQPAAVPATSYQVNADVLFRFDGRTLNDIIDSGREEIRRLGAEIQRYAEQIRAVRVIGHSDPRGNEAYNQKLSEDRARTVGQLLNESGLDNRLIQIEGRGEAEPVVPDCAREYPRNRAEQILCNRPNRRVEIIVDSTL